jgi:hypothetical protein
VFKQGPQDLMDELDARGDEAAVRRLVAARANVNVRNEVGEQQCMLHRNGYCMAVEHQSK